MRRILTVVIGLCGFCLHGCEDVVNIDLGKEKPVLVLNCILVEGDDTVRVAVSQTRPTRDTTAWKTFPEAEVQLFKNGEFVGQAEWNGKDCFVLPCRVEAEQTYRVVARVPGRGTVSGETTVPAKIKDYKLEIWQEVRSETFTNGFEAKYHWRDLADRIHYYWLTCRKSKKTRYDWTEEQGSVLIQDSLEWIRERDLYTESPLPDRFNIEQDMDEWGGCSTFYNTYIRIEGVASEEKFFDLSYKTLPSDYFATIISLINADYHCDAYLSCIVDNYLMIGAATLEPWLFRPNEMYSNIEGGTGIVGSYSVVETRLDSPNKPGKWGPGVPYRR